ncbi:MAG: alpha/beta fold hydrolase [Phycisphaerales bacterium]
MTDPIRSLVAAAAASALGATGVAVAQAGVSTGVQTGVQSGTAGVPLISRDVLFGNPERANVQLSPDSKYISYLAPKGDVLNVWIMPAGGGDARAVTNSTDRPIRSYGWAWNSGQILYSQDRGGDENTSVYAVDIETGEERDLTPADGAKASIMASHRDRPDHILVMINDRNPQLQDVKKINTRTGAEELVFQNDEGWVGFVTDDEWTIRGRARMTADGGLLAEMRDAAESSFYEFEQVPMEDMANFGLLGLNKAGDRLFVTDPSGRDTSALVSVTPAPEGGRDRQMLFSSPESDVADILINPLTLEPEAVATNRLRKKWTILDPAVEGDFARLGAMDEGDFEVIDRSRDDRTWVVAYLADDGPVKYWVYDRDAGNGRFLFTNRPALEGLPLVSMQTVEVPTRDGLSMPSYLTMPKNADGAVPMVLLVHGGPWARDSWGYNPYHQWLANRGYAVLSVNFRGSTGFGKSFMNAGNREWYKKMQDDLVDAVNWAVGEGHADADRVAIMGGSYGGYATLAGLTRDPDLFACGVDIVGPSHVRTLLETIPPYWEPIKVMFEQRVGALHESEHLDAISPLTHVDNIQRPLLIGQGANDPRVKISESDQIVTAMQSRDIPVTYVVFPDEGHGFAKPTNNKAFNAVVEVFLAKHLNGRYEPVGDIIAASTAQIRALGDIELEGVKVWDPADAVVMEPIEGEISLDSLNAEMQEAATQAISQLKNQMETNPQIAAFMPMIIGQLEASLANASSEDELLMNSYILQELKKIVGGG